MLEHILRLEEEYKDEILKIQQDSFPLVLFGAGSTSDFIIEQLNGMNIYPVAFCDNDKGKQGTIIAGIPVYNMDEVCRIYPEAYFYITTQLYYSIIRQQLVTRGIKEEMISEYDIVIQMEWEKEFLAYCQEHEAELESFCESLADEKSRRVLYHKLAFYRTRNRKYITEIRDLNQYFDDSIIDFKNISSFVDLGMFTGDTILEFLKHAENECEIWGFEPDENIALEAEAALQYVKNLHIVRKATSDSSGMMKVKNSLGIMQTIADGLWDEDDNIPGGVFSVCTLDEFFAQQTTKLDFIKMDIEGAEYPTLLGAQKILKRDLPVLAVCVYHKKEDLFTIPSLLLSISEKYQLYLRHYSDNQTETVCYAVPRSE